MKNIWQELKKPIFIQAPMENVTDSVFRRMLVKCGKPDIFFTEFTSCDGLLSPKGKENVIHRLCFKKEEKPIIAQIWGNNPEEFYKVAKLLKEMEFDGIDINMGCPDKTIVKNGAGAGLIKNMTIVKEIIDATKKGAGNLPISVKTRLGYNFLQTEEWIGLLLKMELDAITIHARIATQMSKGKARWGKIGEAVKLRNKLNSKTLIIGNGDVKSLSVAYDNVKTYGVDGVMIGRGIFDNPWIFNPGIDPQKISVETKLNLLIEHITLFQNTWGDSKKFYDLRKFYKIYVNGFPNASDFRMKLMELSTADETIELLKTFANNKSAAFYS